MSSETTQARIQLARQNEEAVIAESALAGEKRVAAVRMFILMVRGALIGISSRLGGRGGSADAVRFVVIVIYLAFSLAAFRFFRRPREIRAVKRAPVMFALVDFGFLAFNGIWTWHLERVYQPEWYVAGCAAVLCFAIARYHWWHALLGVVLAFATYLAIALYAGQFDLSSTVVVFVTFLGQGLLIGWINTDLRAMFVSLRRRDALTRFLAKPVVDRLLDQGDAALEPTQREVTILFSDIRNFTAFSETQQPSAVLRFLDEYFADMTQIVKAHHGMVNKFIGDGMLALWGAPDRMADHAEAALKAALDMRRVLAEINSVRRNRGEPEIRIGIGIHTGTVAAGMLGGTEFHEYTVIGDAVNLASRIEGLTKEHGCDILVSQSAWQQAGARFIGTRVGAEKVKGRDEPVVVWALQDRRAS